MKPQTTAGEEIKDFLKHAELGDIMKTGQEKIIAAIESGDREAVRAEVVALTVKIEDYADDTSNR